MSESNLDRGLADAFGAPSERSVLHAIERLTGEAPRVLLRDADSHSGASPMIDASSSERRSIPQGRGSYQILGEIARGGMGVVMKGHDTDLGRDVALKVLHKELAKRPEVLQRFVEEAQIGGQLQHPGIVPVYELGLMADERPYFTMKLVKGRTLAALLAERKSAGVDRRKLLDVFESVCQTMAYAHSRGVIHRDLKPANVMVGAFGEVQVVDWGLAKVLRQGGTADEKRAKQTNISIIETVRSEPGSHGSHSLVGSVMGTPAYMSPEQARGEIEKLDEHSDVFSLGAVLCEILTGAPPYLGESERTAVEAASAKLDDASQRLDGCRADRELVALCRECLAPAQSARPRSAEVLAQRIHDHLISVEERARRAHVDAAEARVKAREERRARKLTAGLAASVLVTVLVAGGGWAWMSSEKSRRERDTETQVSAALNEATLKRGEGQWAEALAAAERAEGLADSGAASDELRARVANDLAAIESESKMAREKDELARDNIALLAELADIRQPEGDTTYPTDWAKLDADHGAIFTRHGFNLDEQSQLEASDALSARGIPVELAGALDEWASVRSGAEDKVGATHLWSLARRIDADATRDKLRDVLLASDVSALKAFAAHEDLTTLPATTLHLLGKALRRNGATNDAIAVLRQAQQSYPGDLMVTMSLARALMSAAPPLAEEATRYYTAALALRPSSIEAAHELGETLDASLKDYRRAMEVFRNAIALHPQDGHLRAHLAGCLCELGDLDGALVAAREATALLPNSAWPHTILGGTLYLKGDVGGAITAYRRAIELGAKDSASYLNLSSMLNDTRDFDGAILACRKAIDIDPSCVRAYSSLGNALKDKGELDGAIVAYRKALELDPKYLAVYCNLGLVLLRKGDFDGALAAERAAIALDPNCITAYLRLGAVLNDGKHDHDGAIAAFRKALELDPKFVDAQYDLAFALEAKGDVDGSVQALLKTIELDPRSADARYKLGLAFERKHDRVAAIENFRKAIEIDPPYVSAVEELGVVLAATGDYDAAIASYRKVLEIDPRSLRSVNGLAWLLATCVDHSRRDAAEAVRLAKLEVELAPEAANSFNDLGAALCCAGDWSAAIEALDRSIGLTPDKDGTGQFLNAVNHCFLAAARAHLGELEQARADWALAKAWCESHREHVNAAETARLLDEARAAIAAGSTR